jgi:DNA-binding MarR family transcriptional regulator
MKTAAAQAKLDHESRLDGDDHQSLRLWLRLLTCTNLIERALRRRLRERFATTLPRFDLLAQLERSPNGLTMGELSERMMVSGGNVSGIASQLETEGLISKTPVPGNRRAYCARLTHKGRQQFGEMARAHEEWLRELLDGLPSEETQQLMESLRSIKTELSRREV